MDKKSFDVYLFFISYTFVLANAMLSCIKNISDILNITNNIALCILFIMSFFNINKTRKKDFLIYLSVILVSFISAMISKDNAILKIFLLIMSCKGIEFNKIVKYDMFIKLFFVILVLILYNLNLTNNYFMYRSDGTIRSSMGFAHPNIFGAFIMSLVMEFLYVQKSKINISELIIIFIIMLVVDHYSNSRTSEICAIITSIVLFLNSKFTKKVKNKKYNLLSKVNRNMFLILGIVSFLLGYMYSKNAKIALVINEITTGRVKLIDEFFNYYPINLFGNYIRIIGTHLSHITHEKSWILDNSYSLILLRYGLLIFSIITIGFNSYIKKLQDSENKKLELIIIIFLFYGLMETGVYKIEFNIFLLFFSSVIFKKGEPNNE